MNAPETKNCSVRMQTTASIKYPPLNLKRMPKSLQTQLAHVFTPTSERGHLGIDKVHEGDARILLPEIAPNSVAVSVWSPPYFVGKSYEAHLEFEDWQSLLRDV